MALLTKPPVHWLALKRHLESVSSFRIYLCDFILVVGIELWEASFMSSTWSASELHLQALRNVASRRAFTVCSICACSDWEFFYFHLCPGLWGHTICFQKSNIRNRKIILSQYINHDIEIHIRHCRSKTPMCVRRRDAWVKRYVISQSYLWEVCGVWMGSWSLGHGKLKQWFTGSLFMEPRRAIWGRALTGSFLWATIFTSGGSMLTLGQRRSQMVCSHE